MLPWTGQVYSLSVYQLRVLVLFVYSVQHGRKFHWQLPSPCKYSTSDRHTVRPEFCLLPQPHHSIVGASATSVLGTAICCLTANTHYDPGALIPERNGLT